MDTIQQTVSSIFTRKQTVLLVGIYIAIRAISFFIASHPIIQATISIGLVLLFAALYFHHVHRAWHFLLAELFLGGSGHFVELYGISIRTLFLLSFLILWGLHALEKTDIKQHFLIPHYLFYLLIPFSFTVIFSMARGVMSGHPTNLIIGDAIPYIYFFLLLPAYRLFQEADSREFLIRLIFVFLLGSALFSLFTFIIYGSGAGILQNSYYHWFRDIAGGKITDLGNNFFRIVLPEHLLLVPALLMMVSLLMRDEKHHWLWKVFSFLTVMTLALNFSRIYILALGAGLLILKYKHTWKKWFVISVGTVATLLLTFIFFSAITSRGQSFGLDLLGLRVGAIARPATDVSASFRLALLPSIIPLIQTHPILGSGLGASVTFVNPQTYLPMTTNQFDWGYLELITELGAIGALLYIMLIVLGIVEVGKKIKAAPDWHDFYVGLIAGAVAFLVMNTTSPALFHVFGILYFVFFFTFSMKPPGIFDTLIQTLYRVFHPQTVSSNAEHTS